MIDCDTKCRGHLDGETLVETHVCAEVDVHGWRAGQPFGECRVGFGERRGRTDHGAARDDGAGGHIGKGELDLGEVGDEEADAEMGVEAEVVERGELSDAWDVCGDVGLHGSAVRVEEVPADYGEEDEEDVFWNMFGRDGEWEVGSNAREGYQIGSVTNLSAQTASIWQGERNSNEPWVFPQGFTVRL